MPSLRYLATIIAVVRRGRWRRVVVIVMVVIARRRRLGGRLSSDGLRRLHNRGVAAGEGQHGGGRNKCQQRFGSCHSCSSIVHEMLKYNLHNGI